MAGHLADPAVILLHLLSIFNFGSQLFDSMNSAEQRIKALEDGSQLAELGKQSQALSELQKTTDKRFTEIAKQIGQFKQGRHTSTSDKNVTSKIKEVQDKLLRLEDIVKTRIRSSRYKLTRSRLNFSTRSCQNQLPRGTS